MNPVEVVVLALRSLALLAQNPKLGGGGLRSDQISELTNTLASLIEGGQETWEQLQAFAQEVKALADSGASPSALQWQQFRDRDAAARTAIERAAQRLAQAEDQELSEGDDDPPVPTSGEVTTDPSSVGGETEASAEGTKSEAAGTPSP